MLSDVFFLAFGAVFCIVCSAACGFYRTFSVKLCVTKLVVSVLLDKIAVKCGLPVAMLVTMQTVNQCVTVRLYVLYRMRRSRYTAALGLGGHTQTHT